MRTEIEAVEKNNTWKLVELPPNERAIGLKWVYKMKRDTKGRIVKYKARIVAKRYVKKQGRTSRKYLHQLHDLEQLGFY